MHIPEVSPLLILTLCACLFSLPNFTHYRNQYKAFMSDVLYAREKENKTIHDEVQGIFVVVNVEEDSSTAAGIANLDRRLCEQVFEI